MQFIDVHVSTLYFVREKGDHGRCFTREFVWGRGVKSVEIRIDDEDDVQYVHMEDPSATEITFVRAPCPSKEVMYVQCAELGKGNVRALVTRLRTNHRNVVYV